MTRAIYLTFYTLICIQSYCLFSLSANRPDQLLFQASLSHIEGRGVGYHQGYTTLELLTMPLCSQKGFYPFIDLRGHGFNNRKLAANVGIGFRKFVSEDYCFGANFYYDVCQGSHRNFAQVGHTFQRAGIGFELFMPALDFRVNVYHTLGKERWKGRQLFFNPSDPSHPKTKTRIVTMAQGFDAEIGRALDEGILGCNFNWCTYGAAGTYYLSHPKNKDAWGATLRFEATFNRYYNVEVRSTYDRVNNGIVQVKFEITFPLCSSSSERCTVITPVERAEIIPLFSKAKKFDRGGGIRTHDFLVPNQAR